jgi:hypothetical protein
MPLALEQRKVLLGVMRDLFPSSIDEFSTFLSDNMGRNLQEIVVADLQTSRSRVLDRAVAREWLGELVESLKDIAGPEARAKLDTVDVKAAYAPVRSEPLMAALKQSLSAEQSNHLVNAWLGQAVAGGNGDAALQDAAARQFIGLAKAVRGLRNIDPKLRSELEELGLLTATPGNLEKIVKDSNSLLEIGVWVGRLTAIEGYVCRIAKQTALGLEAKGTGFLVGPSVVLTNHHVVADVLAGELDPKLLRAQFDHRVLKDGSTESGTIVGVDLRSPGSWKIDVAPHGAIDAKVHPIDVEPGETELDYALLLLDTPVGKLPIGKAADGAAAPQRGWLDLEEHGANAKPDTPIFIVQHPAGLPMKLALDTEGAIGYSPNGLRMRYRTNTLRGSSGSPVFNENLEVIALHHAGDPKYPELKPAEYNEGIPIPALLRQFKARGLLERLTQ